jgi:hypothetical protein
MPLHNAQTHRAFQTPMLVHAYRYVTQNRWWFCNTNHVTQASANLAPDRQNRVRSPSRFVFVLQRKDFGERKVDKLATKSINRTCPNWVTWPSGLCGVSVCYKDEEHSLLTQDMVLSLSRHTAVQQWRRNKLSHWSTCIPMQATVKLCQTGGNGGPAAPILYLGTTRR